MRAMQKKPVHIALFNPHCSIRIALRVRTAPQQENIRTSHNSSHQLC
jgi:hypothetical protein